jgi:hypothetical protein
MKQMVLTANMTCVQGHGDETCLLGRAGADTPAVGEVSGDSPRLVTVQQLATLAATMLRLLLELYGAHLFLDAGHTLTDTSPPAAGRPLCVVYRVTPAAAMQC